MCNAWNHSVDCTCGWGGEGHAGRRSVGSTPYIPFARPIFKTYSEYLVGCTIPNAKCPVCGDPVFFYRSPSNGRVFFDELGPPWPKHPCTIKSYKSTVISIPANADAVNTTFQWYINSDWKPFLVEGIFKADAKNNISEIVGYIGDCKRSFFTKLEGITIEFPFFINECNPEVRLLTFNPSAENYLFEFVVKNYQSELGVSILDKVLEPRKTAVSIKKRDFPKQKPNKKFKNKLIDKTGDGGNAKSKVAQSKVVGKFQDQLLKLKGSLKSN